MKKTLICIILIFIIITCSLIALIINNNSKANEINKFNQQYEQYLNKELIGTELATIINKTVDYNQKNNVQKDEKGYYISNGQDSIKIDLRMIVIDEKTEEAALQTFEMEPIYNRGITEFVQNFNLIEFKCSDIEYHKQTGKVSKITFEQLEE